MPKPIHANDPVLPARYYHRLLDLLAELGPSRALEVRSAADSLPAASDPLAEISLALADQLGRRAAQWGPADIGLRLGLAIDAESHDELGLALLQARSVEQALQLAARYFFLLSPGFRMRYLPDTLCGCIEVTPWLAFSEHSLALHLDVVLGALYRQLTQLSERPMPDVEVRVSWPRPAHTAAYRRLRGWRIAFDSFQPAGFHLRLPADWLRCAREHTDADRRDRAEARCAERMRSVRRQRRLADWTRMMLREAAATLAQGELARLSGVSQRSYHRQLQGEGTSFRALQNEARMRAALRALEQGRTVTAVASDLDYANTANFSRAFRRAFGHPPSQIRPKSAASRRPTVVHADAGHAAAVDVASVRHRRAE